MALLPFAGAVGTCLFCDSCVVAGADQQMTPEESTDLKIGDRVRWQDDVKDQGEVVGRDWSGVEIKWDKGKTTYYYHNDMQDVTRLPTVV